MDSLCTLAKIEEEKRTLEAMERKRKAKEEGQRSRKERKTSEHSKAPKQDDNMAINQDKDQATEVSALLAKEKPRQKSLSRHTSTASAAEGGVSLM